MEPFIIVISLAIVAAIVVVMFFRNKNKVVTQMRKEKQLDYQLEEIAVWRKRASMK